MYRIINVFAKKKYVFRKEKKIFNIVLLNNFLKLKKYAICLQAKSTDAVGWL